MVSQQIFIRLKRMKNSFIVFLFFSFSSLAQSPVLFPEAFLKIVQTYHPIAKQAGIGVQKSEAQILQARGGFDNAIGTYQKFLDYRPPMMNLLTVPLLIVGLEAPLTFYIDEHQHAPRKKIGRVRMI